MTIADAYRRLGAVLSGLEAEGIQVSDVIPAQNESEDALRVDLRIEIPMAADAPEPAIGGATNPTGAVTDGAGVSDVDGTGAATDAAAEPAGSHNGEADADGEKGTAAGNGATADASETDSGAGSERDPRAEARSGAAYPCDAPGCGAGFDSEAALSVHRFVDHEALDEPIHKHEPALRAAYDAYDSFASMTDALGVDVTPQTVRRNMMKFGIHEPETGSDASASDASAEEAPEGDPASADRDDGAAPDGADTSADQMETDSSPEADDGRTTATEDAESAAEERTVTDGAGAVATGTDPDDAPEDARLETLPADVSVPDLRAAVVEGGSLRAAAQRLDRSRGATRDLLQSNDLLELVHGRVATRPEREERAAMFEDWLEAQPADDIRRS